jgi:hypothetical protein
MSNLTNSLKDYLSGFKELSNWNDLTSQEKKETKCKLASYVTLAVPLIALIIYGGSLAYDSLLNRISPTMPEPIAKEAEITDEIGKKVLLQNEKLKEVEETQIKETQTSDSSPFLPEDKKAPIANKINSSTAIISPLTIFSREKLNQVLNDAEEHAFNHSIVETPNNGDCFYAAFAAALNESLSKKYTALEMRKIVSEEINKLNKDNPNNWVKQYLDHEYGNIDSYEDYLTSISDDFEQSLKKNNRAPIWGKEVIDGVILCRHFNVNLHVTEIIPITDEVPKSVDDFVPGDNTYPHNEKYAKEIKIALYSGHFLGLIPSK